MSFENALVEIHNGRFLIVDTPSSAHISQKSFLIELRNYPFIVPFELRSERVVQLITMYPDRRYKNGRV